MIVGEAPAHLCCRHVLVFVAQPSAPLLRAVVFFHIFLGTILEDFLGQGHVFRYVGDLSADWRGQTTTSAANRANKLIFLFSPGQFSVNPLLLLLF